MAQVVTDEMHREFHEAYMEAAAFTDCSEDDGEDRAEAYFSEAAWVRSGEDCMRFLNANIRYITDANCLYKGCSALAYAGHDFWLTRNRHGCGFWDGDWKKRAADALTAASQAFGNVEVELGGDGELHFI